MTSHTVSISVNYHIIVNTFMYTFCITMGFIHKAAFKRGRGREGGGGGGGGERVFGRDVTSLSHQHTQYVTFESSDIDL